MGASTNSTFKKVFNIKFFFFSLLNPYPANVENMVSS